MKTAQATLAAAVWIVTTVATIGCTSPAYADPAPGPCDPEALTVAAGQHQSGLGHRAVQLNFTLPAGASACQLSGYPTVDAFAQAGMDADGASPIPAKQTPGGYLGSDTPVTTVTLVPGHGAHAMVEWVAAAGRQDPCTIYGSTPTGVSLSVTPPGMSRAYHVPITVGRNEGLCSLLVHPLVGD
jgi:hypothetical protein